MKRISLLVIVLFLAFSAHSFSKDKKKYDISKMPKALYLINPQDKNAKLEFELKACPSIEGIGGSAYSYLYLISSQGNRRTGSQAMRYTAELVRRALEQLGYESYYEGYLFPYYHFNEGDYYLYEKGAGRNYKAFPIMYSMPTDFISKDGLIKSKVVKKWQKINGNIVLLSNPIMGVSKLNIKAKKLKEKGALGLIVDPKAYPIYSSGLPVPMSIHQASWHYGALAGLVVENAKELKGKEIEIKNTSKIYAGKGYNVVGISKGNFKQYVLVSGHLDSWYQGALDDASGVSVMLRVAELLKETELKESGLIFLSADGEEIGLFGSMVFAERFGTEKIKAMIELDMVSSKNNFLKSSPDKAKNLPRIISTTTDIESIVKEELNTLPGKNIYVGISFWSSLYGSLPTDYEWFYAQGVPGVFIYCPSKFYHTEKDTIEWIDREDLEAVAISTSKLVKRLLSENLTKPHQDSLEFEFEYHRQPDGKIVFTVRRAESKKGLKPKLKAKVRCYYEMGFEREVELKPCQGGELRSAFSPHYKGEYKFVATVTDGKKTGKKIGSMTILDPLPEEK